MLGAVFTLFSFSIFRFPQTHEAIQIKNKIMSVFGTTAALPVLSSGAATNTKRHFVSKGGVSAPTGGSANKDRGDGMPVSGSNYSETPSRPPSPPRGFERNKLTLSSQRPNGVSSLAGLTVFPDDEANATVTQNNYKSNNDKNNITTNQRVNSGGGSNNTTNTPTKNPAVVTERPISMDNANPSVNSNIKVVRPTAEVIHIAASLPSAEKPAEGPTANTPSTLSHETQTSTTTEATTTAAGIGGKNVTPIVSHIR